MEINLSLFIRVVIMIIAFMVPFTVLWSHHVRMEKAKEKEKLDILCSKVKLDNEIKKYFKLQFEMIERGTLHITKFMYGISFLLISSAVVAIILNKFLCSQIIQYGIIIGFLLIGIWIMLGWHFQVSSTLEKIRNIRTNIEINRYEEVFKMIMSEKKKVFYRFKKFTRRDWIAGGAFGALTSIVSIIFGYALAQALGPGMAIINGLMTAIVISIGLLVIGKVGSGLLIYVITSILVIATPQLGPPGPQKIIMGLGLGLVIDFMFLLFRKYPKIGMPITMATMNFVYVWLLVLVLNLFHLESARFMALAWNIALVGAAMGAIGGFIGYWLWKKYIEKRIIL